MILHQTMDRCLAEIRSIQGQARESGKALHMPDFREYTAAGPGLTDPATRFLQGVAL